jgi:membrane-bound ClpP family serine protease
MRERPFDIVAISALYWGIGVVFLVFFIYALQFFSWALLGVIIVIPIFIVGCGFWTGADWAYTYCVVGRGWVARRILDTYNVRV